MKILIIVDRMDVLGGLELHALTIVNGLSKYSNIQVMLYTNSIKEYFINKINKNIQIIETFTDDNNKFIINNFKPDIIHGHPFSGIGIANLISKSCDAKLFITMHGDYSTGLTNEYILKAEKIIFVSETAINACKSMVPINKRELIVNPIDTDVFTYKNKSDVLASLKTLEGFNNDYFTIVVSSRIDDNKEIPMFQLAKILPELANRINGLNIIFIGSGTKIHDLQRVTTYNQENLKVFILGGVGNVADYLNISDLVLGCDRCAIEAILCKKPVLYMGIGGFKSLITIDNYLDHLFTKNNFSNFSNQQLLEYLFELISNLKSFNDKNTLYNKLNNLCGENVIKKHLSLYGYEIRKNIKIIWATIRPDLFIINHKRWMDNVNNKNNIQTYVAVNTEFQKEILLNYDNTLNITVCGETLGVCKPIYELTKDLQANDDDILIVVCDDVAPIESWDNYLLSLFSDINIKSVYINDGLQDINNNINPVISMPVMTFNCFKRLNRIIFNPEYKHYFADNELYFNLKELGLLTDIRTTSKIFQHEHYDIGKRSRDNVDNRIIGECGNYDREVYFRRMKLSIEDRLK